MLENQEKGLITPKNSICNFKGYEIYKFETEFNLIKERNDKNKATLNFAFGNNPLYERRKGEG